MSIRQRRAQTDDDRSRRTRQVSAMRRRCLVCGYSIAAQQVTVSCPVLGFRESTSTPTAANPRGSACLGVPAAKGSVRSSTSSRTGRRSSVVVRTTMRNRARDSASGESREPQCTRDRSRPWFVEQKHSRLLRGGRSDHDALFSPPTAVESGPRRSVPVAPTLAAISSPQSSISNAQDAYSGPSSPFEHRSSNASCVPVATIAPRLAIRACTVGDRRRQQNASGGGAQTAASSRSSVSCRNRWTICRRAASRDGRTHIAEHRPPSSSTLPS